jgi:hypothetical protein
MGGLFLLGDIVFISILRISHFFVAILVGCSSLKAWVRFDLRELQMIAHLKRSGAVVDLTLFLECIVDFSGSAGYGTSASVDLQIAIREKKRLINGDTLVKTTYIAVLINIRRR